MNNFISRQPALKIEIENCGQSIKFLRFRLKENLFMEGETRESAEATLQQREARLTELRAELKRVKDEEAPGRAVAKRAAAAEKEAKHAAAVARAIANTKRDIERAEKIIARTEPKWNKPMETPSTFETGASNYAPSLRRRHEREVTRHADAFREYQQAKKDLDHLQVRLHLLEAGKINPNGSRRKSK